MKHIFSALTAILAVVTFGSCENKDLVEIEGSDKTMSIETIPALFGLECADRVNLTHLSSQGVFKLYGLKRDSWGNVSVDIERTAWFKPGTNLLVWEGSAVEWAYERYEYKFAALYPADASLSLDSCGEPVYDRAVLTAETEWAGRKGARSDGFFLHFTDGAPF